MTIESRLKSIQARDLMTKFAITAAEDETIIDLANLFIRFKISGVPILNDKEEITGIVTSANLFDHMNGIMDEIESDREFQYDCNMFVKDIMTPEVFSIQEDSSLYDMIKLMRDKHIYTLPVVVDGKLIGVVGRRDVMDACYSTICCSQK